MSYRILLSTVLLKEEGVIPVTNPMIPFGPGINPTRVIVRRRKPPPSRTKQLARRLLRGFVVYLLVCGLAYLVSPHDPDKNVIPPVTKAQYNARPKGTEITAAIECVKNDPKPCVAAKFLARQHQLAESDLQRSTAAQSVKPTSLEQGFAKVLGENLHFAWVVLLIVIVVWVITQISRAIKRRRLRRMFIRVETTREVSTFLAVVLLAFAAISPTTVVKYSSAPQKAVVAIASVKSDSLANFTKERLILDPFADAEYRGSDDKTAPAPSRETARYYANDVLSGKPVPAEEYKAYAQHHRNTGIGHTESVALGSFAYTVGINGPSWLLTTLVFLFRQLFSLLLLGIIPWLGIWAMSRKRDLRRGLGAYAGLTSISLIGLFVSAGLLWLFNWISVLMIDVMYMLPLGAFSGLRWYLGLIFCLSIAGSAVMSVLTSLTRPRRVKRHMRRWIKFVVGPQRPPLRVDPSYVPPDPTGGYYYHF